MNTLIITKDNFRKEVIESNIPVMLDLSAAWCGPCKLIAPFIDQIADEFCGKIKVGKVDVDDEPELAALYNIASIPAVIVIKNGTVVNQSIGYRSKEDLIKLLDIK